VVLEAHDENRPFRPAGGPAAPRGARTYFASGLAEAEAAELSHGDQRLLEIALALSTQPRLLLLDEPTAGLSAKETRDMVGVVRQLSARQTIIVVEHDMDVVMELADVITVLHMGRILAEGPPRATRENPLVQEVYLGVG